MEHLFFIIRNTRGFGRNSKHFIFPIYFIYFPLSFTNGSSFNGSLTMKNDNEYIAEFEARFWQPAPALQVQEPNPENPEPKRPMKYITF
uniref:Uncharacterized protein n=1 Tax=Candidatus Kentrum sp. UNK TaxID=2126344 RepID=A0A451AFR8_9GAMM|nr:MAG: hypothetical protein BECKUNK1418G_GA0071005_10538 [Candidatus Kentron sp. UNK]VFK71277.1 MAG: hypothetical protein BECKUNK1418H_GA0071006_105815 [Candidatus Kentron sp. UNK]